MKRTLVCCIALIALGLTAPLTAEPVYVPVIDAVGADGSPLDTQLWISNFDGVETPYSSVFLKSETDGTTLSGRGARAMVPAEQAVYLKRAADEGETGLLEIDIEGDVAVNAWIETRHNRRTFYAGVPVITSAIRVGAGEAAYLNGVGRDGDRDVSQVALVNLGQAAALCQADAVGADGALSRTLAALEVPALSMRRFEDALGLRGEAAGTVKVSCDQPFYAFAMMVDQRTSEVSFINPAAAVEEAKARRNSRRNPNPTKATITFTRDGLFHNATRERPKQIVRIPVPREMAMARITAEFDVEVGPWSPRLKSGIHNMMWFHRGRFRSNTIANINAVGTKNIFRDAQNLDLPRGLNTKGQSGYQFQQGKTYHVVMLYDAVSKAITCTLALDGHVERTVRLEGTAKNREISVSAAGLVAEFGNYVNQHLPEVASVGWKFKNFRLEMIEK